MIKIDHLRFHSECRKEFQEMVESNYKSSFKTDDGQMEIAYAESQNIKHRCGYCCEVLLELVK